MSRFPKRPTLADISGTVLSNLFKAMTGSARADAALPQQLERTAVPTAPPMVRRPYQSMASKRREEREAALLEREGQNPAPAVETAAHAALLARATKSKITYVPLDERQRKAAVTVRNVVAAAFPSVDETRPTLVTRASASQIEKAVEAGAAYWATQPQPDDDGFIVGFDFGTSSVKLAVRQPYQAGDPVKALSTPKCLQSPSTPHPHLWPSVVWFDPNDDTFKLIPTPDRIALDGFKSGLISGHGDAPADPRVPISRAEAAAAFLALKLAHLFGWYGIERPLGEIGSRDFLSINFGLPVQSMGQQSVVAAFAKVVRAAHALAPYAANLTLDRVRSEYGTAPSTFPPGFKPVPELTAAIAGYTADPTVRSGAHMLVDVGAATLDIVAFNLLDRGERVSVFAAGVDMFGAAALQWARAGGITDPTFKDACDHQFDDVWSEARSPAMDPAGFDPRHRREAVKLITTGGGCATELHTKFISEMVNPDCLGAGTIDRPMPPRTIASQNCDLSRMLLAYGLTRDEPELARCKLPNEIERIAPNLKPSLGPMISKDQV
jgi:hypothetical protein